VIVLRLFLPYSFISSQRLRTTVSPNSSSGEIQSFLFQVHSLRPRLFLGALRSQRRRLVSPPFLCSPPPSALPRPRFHLLFFWCERWPAFLLEALRFLPFFLGASLFPRLSFVARTLGRRHRPRGFSATFFSLRESIMTAFFAFCPHFVSNIPSPGLRVSRLALRRFHHGRCHFFFFLPPQGTR